MLAATWCRNHSRAPVGWVDASDLAGPEATAAVTPAIVHLAGRDTTRPVDHDALGWEAAELANTPAGVLVMDGVEAPDLAAELVRLAVAIDRAPGCGLRVIAISRAMPPATLMPLVLRERAVHLTREDLSFDAAQTAAAINAVLRVPITMSTASEVAARMHGWVVGARILGLSFRDAVEPSADQLFAAAGDGIEAYVTAEILNALSDEERHFVLLTSCVEDLIPALCDAMTDRTDSDNLVRRLSNAGLPIVSSPSRPGVMAHVPAIREALDRIASRQLGSQRTSALRLAAEWFSRHGEPFDAAWCYVRLADWDAAVEVIFLHLQRILEADEFDRLADLITAAPLSVLRERASLALGGAFVLRMGGHDAAAFELLAVFEPHMNPPSQAIANVVRCGMVSSAADVEASLAYAETAIAQCDELGPAAFAVAEPVLPPYTPDTDDTYRTIAHSFALLAAAYAGRWDDGERHLVDIRPDTAATIPQLQIVQRHGSRGTFLALSGRATEAAIEARAGLSAAGLTMIEHRSTADAYFAQGESARLMLRHDEARDAFERCRRLAEVNDRVNLVATITASEAHIAVDLGDPDLAVRLVEDFERAPRHRPPLTARALLAAARARAQVATGDVHRALRTLEHAPRAPITASTRATTLAALGQIANAREVIDGWPHASTVDAAVRRQLTIAAVGEASGAGGADVPFGSALRLAADHGLMQPFVEIGPAVVRLIQRCTEKATGSAEREFALAVQRAILRGDVVTATPRLTARESMLLAHLAEGRSLQQIANEVHLSVNTVKTHVQAIYRKLGVTSRVQAVRAYHTATAQR
jgi:LuxR family transcriptional regulator, maltose regulon positive regulatory protein